MIDNTIGALPESRLAEIAVGAAQRGAWKEAKQLARCLLTLSPDSWLGWHLISISTVVAARTPALEPFFRAVWIAPDRYDTLGSLSAALECHGFHSASERSSKRAVALGPFVAEAMVNLGVALQANGKVFAAGRWFDRADTLSPGDPVALNGRALAHIAAGRNDRALVLLRRALDTSPGYADAMLNLAIVERRQGNIAVAVSAVMRAIRLTPADTDYLAELGTILAAAGEARSGIVWLRRALSADAFNSKATVSLLGALCYASDTTESERRAAYLAGAKQVNDTISDELPVRPKTRRRPKDRMAIGYVSPNLNAHPMAHQLSNLLSHHRRDRVRVVAYADIQRRDDVTGRIAELVDTWRETTDLDDRSLASVIGADGIDILVFLALHEEGSRRGLPGLRAAPVQVSLHDIATSGLPSIDAWITTPSLHPAGTAEWFSESLVRIPSLFLFSDLPNEPPVLSSENTARLVFASFNNPAKFSGQTLATWAEILRRMPESVLHLRYANLLDDPVVVGRIRHVLGTFGIESERILTASGMYSRADHLRAVGTADVALDPFPYSGNTATIEALWMGVPVVTLRGQRFLGRMSASILEEIGRDDCIADSSDDYVERAVSLASSPEKRKRLRQTLREDIRRSALCDAGAYARNMENAFIKLTLDLHAKQPPPL